MVIKHSKATEILTGIKRRIFKKFSKPQIEKIMRQKIKNIRKGKLTKGFQYAKSTKTKRVRYGLQTDFVDLTGNNKYSRKSWRMLDSWEVREMPADKEITIKHFKVLWTKNAAAKIYGFHVRKYGDVIAAAPYTRITIRGD